MAPARPRICRRCSAPSPHPPAHRAWAGGPACLQGMGADCGGGGDAWDVDRLHRQHVCKSCREAGAASRQVPRAAGGGHLGGGGGGLLARAAAAARGVKRPPLPESAALRDAILSGIDYLLFAPLMHGPFVPHFTASAIFYPIFQGESNLLPGAFVRSHRPAGTGTLSPGSHTAGRPELPAAFPVFGETYFNPKRNLRPFQALTACWSATARNCSILAVVHPSLHMWYSACAHQLVCAGGEVGGKLACGSLSAGEGAGQPSPAVMNAAGSALPMHASWEQEAASSRLQPVLPTSRAVGGVNKQCPLTPAGPDSLASL